MVHSRCVQSQVSHIIQDIQVKHNKFVVFDLYILYYMWLLLLFWVLFNDVANCQDYIPLVIHEWECGVRGMIVTEENGSTVTEISPSATLSTTNLTCSVLVLNPCLRGERPVTNRLSHSTTHTYCIISWQSAFLPLLSAPTCKQILGQTIIH